ncbi:phosphotransferase [Paenisporosarcina indica]|uniref:phosphotransferase n=1 Tax=Paenisporosarcina indica TaxID=650093 RepID=UPI00094FECC3|nr:phosphotransferase [Paenisporosarcina indica]
MEIVDVLKIKYGISSVFIKQLRNNIYKIQTTEKTYALKVYDWAVNHNFLYTLHQQLKNNDFNYFHQIIPTLDRLNSVTEGKLIYTLSEWIEGVKPSFSNKDHLINASAFLATFHQAALASDYSIKAKGPNDFLLPISFYDVRVGQYYNHIIYEKLKAWVQQFGTDTLRIALERMEYAEYIFPLNSYKELVVKEEEKNTFVHGDYNSSNLILSSKGQMYVLDFDDSSSYLRVSDLVFLCHLYMGKEGERLLDILKSYHRVRPLSEIEFEFLKSQLFVPGKIYWEMYCKLLLDQQVSKEWINQNLSMYTVNTVYNKIKILSYSDLS